MKNYSEKQNIRINVSNTLEARQLRRRVI